MEFNLFEIYLLNLNKSKGFGFANFRIKKYLRLFKNIQSLLKAISQQYVYTLIGRKTKFRYNVKTLIFIVAMRLEKVVCTSCYNLVIEDPGETFVKPYS